MLDKKQVKSEGESISEESVAGTMMISLHGVEYFFVVMLCLLYYVRWPDCRRRSRPCETFVAMDLAAMKPLVHAC